MPLAQGSLIASRPTADVETGSRACNLCLVWACSDVNKGLAFALGVFGDGQVSALCTVQEVLPSPALQLIHSGCAVGNEAWAYGSWTSTDAWSASGRAKQENAHVLRKVGGLLLRGLLS